MKKLLFVLLLLLVPLAASASEGKNVRLIVDPYFDEIELGAYYDASQVNDLTIVSVLGEGNIEHEDTYISSWQSFNHSVYGTLWIANLANGAKIHSRYITVLGPEYYVKVNNDEMNWLRGWAPAGTTVHVWIVPSP